MNELRVGDKAVKASRGTGPGAEPLAGTQRAKMNIIQGKIHGKICYETVVYIRTKITSFAHFSGRLIVFLAQYKNKCTISRLKIISQKLN